MKILMRAAMALGRVRSIAVIGLCFYLLASPALAVGLYADEGKAKAACEEDRAVTLSVKPNALLNSPGRDCSVKDPDYNYFGCFYFYGPENWQCGNAGPNNATYDWQYAFPRGSTCSARPSVNTLMPADGGPQCMDGCEYAFSSNGNGTATASPNGNVCIPVVKFDPGKNNECCKASDPGDIASAGGPNGTGNPINMFVGNKIETVVDYADPAGHLSFRRYYASKEVPLNRGSVLGTHWRHSFQLSVVADYQHYRLNRANGNSYIYRQSGTSWIPDQDVGERLTPVLSGTQIIGWRVVTVQNVTEVYNVNGQLTQLEYVDGDIVQSFYDAQGKLERLTDRRGRSLILAYAGDLLDSVTLPDGAIVKYGYGTLQRLASVSYKADSVSAPFASIQYLYEDGNGPKLLTGIIDESNKRYATWQYDLTGRAVSSQHGDGADRVTVSYGADRSTVTGPLGEAVEYGYVLGFGRAKMASAQKLCPTCAGESVQARTYDANGYPDRLTDFNGIVTNVDYNSRGLLTQRVDSENNAATKRTLQTDWHATLYVPSERRTYDASNALIGRQTFTYNVRGQVLTASGIDPVTSTTRTSTTTYCEQADVAAGTCPHLGLVTSVNGPRADVNDITTYTYYPSDDASCATSPTTCPHRKGDLWMVQDAAGNITETLKYDGAGRVLSMKDANGVVTDFEYHARGWLTARKVRGTDNGSEADDQITRIDYYPTGLVQKTTLPDGSYTSYLYDAAHRLTDIVDGEGNKIHYTLDNAGNRTKEETLGTTGTVLRTLSRVYNQLGQLQTHKDAYDHATGYVYDANGNTDTVTDALNRVTDNDYDPLNRLSKTIQDVGGLNVTTQFKYDVQDNLTEVIDPKNLSTKYTYNGLGDLKRLESPDTGITDYTYDSAGNRKTQTDARGVTATYGYDALNRLVSVSYPDSSLNVGYGYDTAAPACASGETFAAGRLSRITDGSGDTQYCYDRFGQMVRKVQTTAGLSLTLRYGYTKAGQLSSVTYPDGTVADYVRDGLGRTTEIGVTRPGGSRQVLLTSASYYPFGPAAEWVFGNGRLFQRTLNQNYQPGVVQDQSAGGLSLGYEFDSVGNLVKLRNGNQGEPPLRRYAYDALNRLTEARDGTTDALLEGYSYDATGNRLSATDNGVAQAYTIAGTSHRLMAVGGVARNYDNAGNTTAIAGAAREFVYNDANRLSVVKHGGVAAMDYAYNGKGEQLLRSNGGTNTVTVYDEAGHWLGEYEGTGAPSQQVIWLDDLPVGLIVGAAVANQPLHYIEADALSTPRTIIESQRNVAAWNWPLMGEAFGKDQPNEDPDGDGTSLSFHLRFPGQRYDAASGLNQNGFRDYEPGGGRYIESDPIGLIGGLSTFGYVEARPLVKFDRRGLEGIGPWTYPPGPMRDSYERSKSGCGCTLMPQFVQFELNFYVLSVSATYTNSGDVFLGKGVNRGYPNPVSYGVSIAGGWVLKCNPTREEANGFLDGGSLGGSGYAGFGGGYLTNPSGSAILLGVGAGYGLGGSYNTYQGNLFGDNWK